MKTFASAVGIFAAFIVAAICISVVLAFPVMWCWNYLMPIIFGLTKITLWQAITMNILTSILFKSPYNK